MSNPFSTRHVRPGALPYLFPPEASAHGLLAAWENRGRRGAIVGPHGSGKSTLLRTLERHWSAAGRPTRLITLRQGERRLPWSELTLLETRGPITLLVDGYEQLSRWSRLRLRMCVRRQGWGLLVTCHRPLDWPVLWTTVIDANRVRELFRHLTAGWPAHVDEADLWRSLTQHGPDLRETFCQLYHVYEANRRCPVTSADTSTPAYLHAE